ncbi:MAG: putative serine esterase-domain-containing protein [Monoraphidium minutum]|nr:MAG: putative serine esterase-domain-containing protein [Monoraphidium minutum]
MASGVKPCAAGAGAGRARSGAWLGRRAAAAPSRAPTAGAAAAGAPAAVAPRRGPSHLVVFVNGLTGGPSNWDVMLDAAGARLPAGLAADTLLHASESNARLATWDGVDVCGQRLADEVRALAAAPGNGGLTRVSFVCHSMGGLMARYAVGALFNPASGTIAGLQPAHFVTLATPHFGCDSDGVSAVPFIMWSGGLPLLGGPLRGLLQSIAHATGAALLRRTGEQFFLLDGGPGGGGGGAGGGGGGDGPGPAFGIAEGDPPLLFQMTQDVPSKGLYFYSALAAFKTRTAYANTDGDHLVGWANSSLRPLSGLPPLPPDAARAARGVVLEDPLAAAWGRGAWDELQARLAAAGGAGGAPAPHEASRDYSAAAPQAAAGADGGGGGGSAWHRLASGGGSPGSSAQATGASGDEGWGAAGDDDWAGRGAGGAGRAAPAGAQDAAAGALPTAPSPAASAGEEARRREASMDARGAAEAEAAELDLEAGLAGDGAAPAGPSADGSRGQDGGAPGPRAAVAPSSRAGRVAVMLERLSALPWRRIDVSFSGATWGLAHNNIQVTRRILNWQGEAVPRHLVEQLAAMEGLMAAAHGSGGGGGPASGGGAAAAAAGDEAGPAEAAEVAAAK